MRLCFEKDPRNTVWGLALRVESETTGAYTRPFTPLQNQALADLSEALLG